MLKSTSEKQPPPLTRHHYYMPHWKYSETSLICTSGQFPQRPQYSFYWTKSAIILLYTILLLPHLSSFLTLSAISHSIVLYCIVLYCIVLYCIVLFLRENNAPFSHGWFSRGSSQNECVWISEGWLYLIKP